MQYLELAKQYVKPEQVFQIGVIIRAVSVLANLALSYNFLSSGVSASTSLDENLKFLYGWGVVAGRVGFDVLTLPFLGLWAYALLVEGAVDYSDRIVQIGAYGIGIVAILGALVSVALSYGFVSAFNLADLVGTLTLVIQGIFPSLAQLVPAAGFAWLAWDSNVDVAEIEEELEEEAEEEEE